MIFGIVSNVYKLRGDVKSLENRKKKTWGFAGF